MTDTATPPEHDRENQESSEDEGKQSQEQDSEERRQAADSDERTMTESGGYGSPEPPERGIALDEDALRPPVDRRLPLRAPFRHGHRNTGVETLKRLLRHG